MWLKTPEYRITRGQELQSGCAPMEDLAPISGEGTLLPTSRTSPKKASDTQNAFSWPPPASKFMALLVTLSLLVGMMLVFTPSASAATEDSSENMSETTIEPDENQHGYSKILIGYTITRVQIFVSHRASGAEINVRELEGPPTGLENLPPAAQSFFEITTNLEENYEILSATIEFKVPKSWVGQDGAGENSIKLLRLNGKWQELPTTLVDESPSYLYYEAQSPGFSIFALSAEGVPPPTTGLPLALYAAVAAGIGTAGFSLFYWFRRRRIKPSISLEDIKQTVMGREEKAEVDEDELAAEIAHLREAAGGPSKKEVEKGKRRSRVKLATGAELEREKRTELIEKLKKAAKKEEEE